MLCYAMLCYAKLHLVQQMCRMVLKGLLHAPAAQGTEISNAALSSALRSQLTLRPRAVPKFSNEKLQDFEVLIDS